MSEQTPEPTVEEPTGDGAVGTTEVPPEPKREATYRKRAVAAEAERDALRTRIDTMQREAVTALAEEAGFAVGGDLFDVGRIDLNDLRTESGDIDVSHVNEVCADLLNSRPGLRQARIPPADQGVRGAPKPKPGASWADVMRAGR